MLVYICPECGGDLQEVVLASNPPQIKKYCSKCGWSYIENEEIYRVPYQVSDNSSLLIPEACRHCSNHPSNGGSGICHCTLGVPPITW